MKSLLQDNYIEMYSTHNEGKSFVAERFVRTLKNKICKLSTYTDFVVENNDKYLKFKAGDHVRILRFKSIFLEKLHSKLVRRSFCD